MVKRAFADLQARYKLEVSLRKERKLKSKNKFLKLF
jgi:hypothetical protein